MKSIAMMLCLMCATTASEETTPLIQRLLGEWVSDQPTFGAPAQSTLSWREELNGQFFRLDYKIVMSQADGTTTTFEGLAYYKAKDDGPVAAFWADISGFLHPIRVEHEDDAFIAHWGQAGFKQGKTRYRLLDTGQIETTDWVNTEDGFQPFNQNVFDRVEVDSNQ